jgi:hypothetical protein
MVEEFGARHKQMINDMVQKYGPVLMIAYEEYGPLIYMNFLVGMERVTRSQKNPLAEIDDVPAMSYYMHALHGQLQDIMSEATPEELAGYNVLTSEKSN